MLNHALNTVPWIQKNKGKTVANSTIKPAIVYEGGKKRGKENYVVKRAIFYNQFK